MPIAKRARVSTFSVPDLELFPSSYDKSFPTKKPLEYMRVHNLPTMVYFNFKKDKRMGSEEHGFAL
jgi:hypothetical protein